MNSKFNPDDPIPTDIFKKCLDVLGPVVLLIVNKSLKESIFPASLKIASIRPTIKDRNGDKENLKNYRPISNTPFLAKLLEKAALEQINEYIKGQQLLLCLQIFDILPSIRCCRVLVRHVRMAF